MWKWIIGGFVALAVIGAVAGGSEEKKTVAQEASKVAKDVSVEKAEAKPEPKPEAKPETKRMPKPEPKPEPPAEPAEPEFSSGQENAIDSAESYVDMSGFSRLGLIQQLKFEDFSEADATFAADHVDADWNEEAVESAGDYLDMSGFSKQGLIEQLKFEKFTQAQAQYAVDQTYN